MNTLPVVERELRVAARRGGTWKTRLLVASAGVLLLGCFIGFGDFNNIANFSQALFYTLGAVAFLLAGVGGFSLTSDCLSEERREGTLGLLFLTDLSNWDIILGKLAACSLGMIYGLLALVPVLAISILSGGVGLSEFLKVVFTALNLLFLSLSIGMFTSVIYKEASQSLSAAAVLIGLLLVGIPAVCLIVQELFDWHRLSERSALLWPGSCLVLAFLPDTSIGIGRLTTNHVFATSSVILNLLGWFFLLFVIRKVGNSWQETVKSRQMAWWMRWSTGSAARQSDFRKQLLDINPYYWRAAKPRLRSMPVWITLGVAAGVFVCGAIWKTRWFLDSSSILTFCFILHSLIKLWVLIESPRALISDRANGAMELLLVTPLTAGQVVSGQVRSLLRMFQNPAIAVLAMDLLFLVSWSQFIRPTSDERVMFVAMMLVFVTDLVALAALSMALASRLNQENRVVSMAGLWVLVTPWLILLLGGVSVVVLETLGLGSGGDPNRLFNAIYIVTMEFFEAHSKVLTDLLRDNAQYLWAASWVIASWLVDALALGFAWSVLPEQIQRGAERRYNPTQKHGLR